MSLLSLSDLTVELGGRRVVDGVSLTLPPGRFAGLIGPNGAGKTSVLRAALGLIPAGGAIALGDRRLDTMTTGERALAAAYLPQEREIGWPLSVERLVMLGRGPHRRPGAPPGAEDRAAVARAMARMDVAAFAARPATALSGGERARVLIARALAQEAPLLLADEPMAGLDPAHQIALAATFATLAAEGRGVLASIHELGLAAWACDWLVLIDAGRIVAEGSPRTVLTPERLAAVYGVEARIDWLGEVPAIVPFRHVRG
ncbi:MAG: ABC transporter ATP-binding protein [Pseudomonadota bacterium]